MIEPGVVSVSQFARCQYRTRVVNFETETTLAIDNIGVFAVTAGFAVRAK